MPEKSASISQQRIMGMAWAARTGRLDTSKLEGSFKDKIEKIANSKTFSDDTLHKMAKTKHKDPETKRKIPYLIGKGTPEDPERKRKPYKKKAVSEGYSIKSLHEFILEQEFQEFYNGYIDALHLMEDTDFPDTSEMFESFKRIKENMQLNPGMNVMGMGSISMPGAPGTSTDFHNQEVGSGDTPWPFKKDDDEEEEEKRRIKKLLASKKK